MAKIIRSMLNDPMEFDLLEARLLEPTKSPSPEWVATFESYSTDLPEGAARLPGRARARLPRPLPEPHRDARHRARQDRATPARPSSKARARSTSSSPARCSPKASCSRTSATSSTCPAESVADAIPMTFQRRLRPGPYKLVLRVEDLATKKFFRVERDIEVPETGPAPRPARRSIPRAPRSSTPPPRCSRPAQTTLQLVDPHGDMHAGMVRFDTLTTGTDIAEVVFSLDGTEVMRKRKPPWSVELDLGRVPHHARAARRRLRRQGRRARAPTSS